MAVGGDSRVRQALTGRAPNGKLPIQAVPDREPSATARTRTPQRSPLTVTRCSASPHSAPSSMPKVEKVQVRYKVEPLSAFLGQPAPATAASAAFLPATTAYLVMRLYWPKLATEAVLSFRLASALANGV